MVQRILPMRVRAPLWSQRSDIIEEMNLGYKAVALSTVNSAFGRYWTMQFTLHGSKSYIEDWAYNGLGRHIVLYNYDLDPIWEGAVDKLSASVGTLSIEHGPLLSRTATRLRCGFASLDESVYPPLWGQTVYTNWVESSDRLIDRYGLIEKTMMLNGSTPDRADELAQTSLNEMQHPPLEETDNPGGGGTVPQVTVQCIGYTKWLAAFSYSNDTDGTTGSVNCSSKLASVIAADPNSIFSTSTAEIETNLASVSDWQEDDRDAMSVVKGLVAQGDPSYNRWLFYLKYGRIPVFQPVPTEAIYRRSLQEPLQTVRGWGGARIYPQDVKAGNWVFYSDFLIGRTKAQSDLRDDPRNLFVESATFNAPYGLSLQSGQITTLPQMLAQLGLGGQTQ